MNGNRAEAKGSLFESRSHLAERQEGRLRWVIAVKAISNLEDINGR